ncbi:Cyclin-dependent kinases regulatory subunit 1 [Liparis tanakae]|uniref:Cyclin-dependent kinases regulatory subunit n=1 Tax=Liparis tanakae TaxID=230148 RepID=A0A4Z2FRV8_9TELE|nr:Cyclin-dependent kinases regulatory subunit 1 [Liparis tanakae]
MSKKQIYYSDKYNDEEFEYRHVVLPKQLSKLVPSSHLMTEDEWRGLGVQQSQGWIHYMIHKPETSTTSGVTNSECLMPREKAGARAL